MGKYIFRRKTVIIRTYAFVNQVERINLVRGITMLQFLHYVNDPNQKNRSLHRKLEEDR